MMRSLRIPPSRSAHPARPSRLIAAAALLLMLPGGSGRASAQLAGSSDVQSTLPPPPAFAIAQRAAAAGRYSDAADKLRQITASATYKNTPYAAEAFYSLAHLQEEKLHDDNSAIASLNALVNNFSHASFTYPHQSVVVAEREALGSRIDAENHAAALAGPRSWASLPDIKDAVLASGYVLVAFFVNLTGSQNYSYWLALLLISVISRLLLWPLSVKQYRGMKEMQRVQPKLKEIQAKYKNDKATLQAKQVELYREHQINPAAGCVPMLAQIPIFVYIYHAVWLYQYRFSHGTFLWINPAAHRIAPNYLGANLADQDIILLALYSISMYVTQRMMPQATPTADTQQADMQKQMALISSVFFFIIFQNYHWASAFVLYWFFSNVVASIVQLFVMRHTGYLPGAAAVSVAAGDAVVQAQLLDGASTGPLDGNGSADRAAALSGSGNGNGYGAIRSGAARKALTNGSTGVNGSGGASQGMIAPKVHPKKKRR